MSCDDKSTLDPCGCCDNDIPQPEISNPPGQPALAYRIGVHSSFLRRMVARLPRQRLPDGDHAGQRPLTELTSRAADDFGMALVDSWAVVGDVLTFYQERIANEGFLRTATERRSILELARAIGYELKPGVAAETYLAFTVDDSDPTLVSATIPAGTQVQSIPKKQDELPQTFETGDEFTAHVAWNELRPRLTQPQSITAATTILYLKGSSTNLSKGDHLLIVGSEKEANINDNHWDVRRVQAVTVETEKDRTRVTIQAGSSGRPMPANPKIFAFRRQAAIFGHNAANWRTLSNQIRADYLGLDSPDEVTAEDKLEWPNYTIFAPSGLMAIMAAAPGDGLTTPTPPHTPALPDKIDLDSRYDKLVPDSWLLLSLPTQDALCRITDVTEVSRADYNLMAKVSRITLNSPDLSDFEDEVRQTAVLAQSEELKLAEADVTANVDEKSILLNVKVDNLQPGQTLILMGEEVESGVETGELAVIHHLSLHDGLTRLHLENDLDHVYRRESLFIFANVVHATHGETVKNEVLGGGDGARAHQQFTLKKPPLTHVSASTSSGAESELSLRVNGVEWQQEPSLYGLDGKSKSYVVRIDDDAKAHIIFGDGKSGARLPTGQENVTATYRSGIGLAGEVGAGSLTLLKTRPFGVRGANNPLAANGAEDPEKLADARDNAPLTVLTLGRIVSLQDFEDFTQAFAGIGKAQAVAIWNGEQELAHITIADSTGDPVDKQSDTYKNLLDAIEDARDPLREVRVDNFEELTFSLKAKVLIDAAYVWETVKANIEAALLTEYAFEERAFGQPVTAAEIIATIHRIEGVEAVDLDKLRIDRAGEPPFLPVLGAQVATYDPAANQILPAQLLLINPTGITLTEMTV